jgi:hypothetical protein
MQLKVLLVHFTVIFFITIVVDDFSTVKLALDFVWRSILFLKLFTGTYYSIYRDQTRYL